MKRSDVKREWGLSLVESMVGLTVGTIGLTALLNSTTFMHRANSSAELRTDLQDVERTIRTNLSCRNTFAAYGAARPVNCNGAVTPLNKANQSLLQNGKIGDWTIEATCEVINGKNGLSFYATKKLANGSVAKDPMTGKFYDKSNPVGTLFKPSARLCSDYFIGSTVSYSNCNDGEYLKGLDFENMKLNCGVIPVCNPPNILSYDGKAFQCTPAQGQWPSGSYCIVQAQNQGCPAGFASKDPNSCLGQAGGGPLGAECHLLRGGGNSKTQSENMAMGMSKNKTATVVRWAWCCK